VPQAPHPTVFATLRRSTSPRKRGEVKEPRIDASESYLPRIGAHAATAAPILDIRPGRA